MGDSESVRVGGDIVVPTRFAAAVFPQTQSFKVVNERD